MADISLTYATLKTKQRRLREEFPVNLGLRVHRAISWLERAEQEEKDDDARFLFHWIDLAPVFASSLR